MVWLPVSERVSSCHPDGPYRLSENADIVPTHDTPGHRAHTRDIFLLSILLSTLFE